MRQPEVRPNADDMAAYFQEKSQLDESWRNLGSVLWMMALHVLPHSEFARKQIAEQLAEGYPELLVNALQTVHNRAAEHARAIETARATKPAELLLMPSSRNGKAPKRTQTHKGNKQCS